MIDPLTHQPVTQRVTVPPLTPIELSVNGAEAAQSGISWEANPRPDVDATVTLTLTLGRTAADGTVTTFGSVPISHQIKSRELQSGMKGDDVCMLQAALRSLGQSEEAGKMGYAGMPVQIDFINGFGSGTNRAVNRFKYQDELGSNDDISNNVAVVVNREILAKIEEHWNDYLRAFEACSSFPFIRPSKDNNLTDTQIIQDEYLNNWLDNGAKELARLYNDIFTQAAQSCQNAATCHQARKTLLDAWLKKEAGVGHWGYKSPKTNNTAFSIVLGGADEMGSMGFSQIQSRFKYGNNPIIPKELNLYHPADAARGFAKFSNEQAIGGGFYYAFSQQAMDDNQSFCVSIPNYSNIYPHIGNSYTDDAQDRLSKGIMAYNRGAGLSDFRRVLWPEILRKYAPPDDNTPRTKAENNNNPLPARIITRWSVDYALTVKRNAGFLLQNRTWTWVSQRIVSKDTWMVDIQTNQIASPQNNVPDDTGDILVISPGREVQAGDVLVSPGTDGDLDTQLTSFSEVQQQHLEVQEFSFPYTEEDWWYDESKRGESNGKKGTPWSERLLEAAVTP